MAGGVRGHVPGPDEGVEVPGAGGGFLGGSDPAPRMRNGRGGICFFFGGGVSF